MLIASGATDGVGAAATTMLRAFVAFWTVLLESAACTVKLNVPEAEGVPEIEPAEDRLNPLGNCPALMLQLYGVVPPAAARVAEYALLTVAPASELVLIESAGVLDGAAATAMLSAIVAFCAVDAESTACTVKLEVPDVVGVPLITPEAERLKPAGSCPFAILHE